MLGALATVALIVTTGGCAMDLNKETIDLYEETMKCYGIYPAKVNAEFINAASQIELYWQETEQTDRITAWKSITPQIQINRLPNGSLEGINAEGLCGGHYGVLLREKQKLFCDVRFVSWVLSPSLTIGAPEGSWPRSTSYFAMHFPLGPYGALHVTVPVCELPSDQEVNEEWEKENHAVSLSDPSFQVQLRNLMEGRTNLIAFSFQWFERLLEFGVYEKMIYMIVDDVPVTSYVTRPVLLPISLIDEFTRKIEFKESLSLQM